MLRLARIVSYLAITLLLVPIQALALARGWPLHKKLPRFYHRTVCRIFGFDVEVRGPISTETPTLFVANHISYIDIEIFGGLITGSFVAKAEVATWPLFGTLAKLQRTVFVDRRRRTSAAQRDNLKERLHAYENIILFPEGTSSDGNRLLPFKSALFSASEIEIGGKPVTVQPVTIAYTGLNGIPAGRTFRPLFAWYGDMELAGHMWRLLALERLNVSVQFHEPVTIASFESRKKLAEHCERVIADALSAANSGRLDQPKAIVAPLADAAAQAANKTYNGRTG